jgi:heptosyltransferase-1
LAAEDSAAVRRVLLVKTSSMGDIVHMLCAVREAQQLLPEIRFDWICEEAFIELPGLLASVDRVISVATRRWRKSLLAATTRREICSFLASCRERTYDTVIDAQGLLKTACITAAIRCPRPARFGFDWPTSREPLSSLAVGSGIHAPMHWHAIERLRALVGQALGYQPTGPITALETHRPLGNSVMFFHGTTRQEKSWPMQEWIALGRALDQQGLHVQLAWGTPQEQQVAETLMKAIGGRTQLLPKLSLAQLAQLLRSARAAVGVDSGLMHLAVALGTPTVAVMSASHLERFSASRFAPNWAAHARVMTRTPGTESIPAQQVLAACLDLGLIQ